jgi:hypothetical protein
MRNAGDKVVIKLNSNYIYFSVRDERDNGTIVDFVQFRKRLSLGEVRKELRPWIGRAPTSLPRFAKLEKTGKDRTWRKRGRCPPIFFSLTGMIRMDVHGNAVFPHFDQSGLCGYELKNRSFTGFAPGGEKGLWSSHEKDGRTACLCRERHRYPFPRNAVSTMLGTKASAARPIPDSQI